MEQNVHTQKLYDAGLEIFSSSVMTLDPRTFLDSLGTSLYKELKNIRWKGNRFPGGKDGLEVFL
jgi:hypothetical protein